jgi:ABC-2 type transport system ATP-binding protein
VVPVQSCIMPAMPVIEARSLTKVFRTFRRRAGVRGALLDLFRRRYEDIRAVDGISFSLEAGERVGYIGPNGAGKSTTLKMLTGILVPTAGSVRVDGRDPHAERERCVRRIGAVFGQRSQLWWDVAPIESLRLLAGIYGMARGDLDRRLVEFEGALGIGPYLRTPVRKLSLGEKMRCELAAALVHGPGVVFLDEPTIGLDLVAKEGIRRFLLEENRRRGTTLILTTHDLSDIEELCERVVIIDRGKLLWDGGLEDLKRRMGVSASLVFHLSGDRAGPDAPPPPGRDPAAILPRLKALTADRPVRWSVEDGGAFRATFPAGAVPRAELIRRVLDRFEAADIAMAEEKIEDVIRRIYAGQGPAAPGVGEGSTGGSSG